MRVSYGTWLVGANARTNCSKAGEADKVNWDAVPEVTIWPVSQPQNSNQTFGTRINWKPGASTLVRLTMALCRCVEC